MTRERGMRWMLGLLATLWLGALPCRAEGLLPVPAAQLRAEASARGLVSHDAAGRLLLASPDGQPASSAAARTAVDLAPELPAAHAAGAKAALISGQPGQAFDAMWGTGVAVARNLVAALWVAGHGLLALSLGLLFGAAVFIAFSSAGALRPAAHDLGDALGPRTSGIARIALLAGLVMLPAALGGGLLGLLGGLLAVAFAYGPRRRRLALGLAAGLAVAALYPGLEFAARALAAPAADPIARAAIDGERAFLLDNERQRLEREAAEDPASLHALALRARRDGQFDEATAAYGTLLDLYPSDGAVANNAANAHFDAGDYATAIQFYERAAARSSRPEPLYNLSQAYGRAIRLSDQEASLAAAQAVDAGRIAELSTLDGKSEAPLVVDLPWVSSLSALARPNATAAALARALRDPVAPGMLGHLAGGAALLLLALFAGMLGAKAKRSLRCDRCGARVCPRCDPLSPGRGVCASCAAIFHGTSGDARKRLERGKQILAQRDRADRLARLASWLVPGAMGVYRGRALLGLALACLFGLSLATLGVSRGVVVDPLVLGEARVLLFQGAAVLLGLGYLGLLLVAAIRRGRI